MPNSKSTFKINSAIQLTGRHFFIAADFVSGVIKEGMEADMSSIGIDKKLIIETIEFVLHREDDNVWEEVALGFAGLTDVEKELLKTQSPFIKSISVNEKKTN